MININNKNDRILAKSIIQDSSNRFTTDAEKSIWNNKENALPTPTGDLTRNFLNANKQWTPIEVSGGGIANNLYLTNINSDVTGYKKLDYLVESTETEFTVSASSSTGEVLLEEFIYDDTLQTTIINAGLWSFTMRCKTSSSLSQAQFKFYVFVRSSTGVETTLFNYTTPVFNHTTYTTNRCEIYHPSFVVNETDRLGIKIAVLQGHSTIRTISLMVGDGYASYFTAPLQMRHSQLRDLDHDINYQHITQTQKDKLIATKKTIISEITDTIETLYWSATAPYTQNITLSVEGHTITDADYDINIYRVSNSVMATDKLEIEAYSYIDKAVISANNTLTLTAYDYKPLTDINVKIEVIKKW